MPRTELTGSRIRQRRIEAGLRQTALAQTVGISPAYLNLIEHNRRRIGGKLLNDIARVLDTDPTALSEGAQSDTVARLQAAALADREANAETDRAEDLAGRFPGWSRMILSQHRRIQALERLVEDLNDRLAHDPQLAASVHEVLSVVTAIRSTAGILADDAGLDPEWRARFLRNLHEDSRRLAESAQALVAYLDTADDDASEGATGITLPLEELEAWLEGRNWRLDALEDGSAGPHDLFETDGVPNMSPAALAMARRFAERYAQDARAIPARQLADAIAGADADPSRLAARFGCDLATVLRRLAFAWPAGEGQGAAPGLVVCDGSGTLTFHKPIDGFALPRFGAACPLWPLYQALARPTMPVSAVVEQAGRMPRRFRTYAVSQPAAQPRFDQPPVFEATMLILPTGADERGAALPIGSSCRICPRPNCVARREPSIMIEGF